MGGKVIDWTMKLLVYMIKHWNRNALLQLKKKTFLSFEFVKVISMLSLHNSFAIVGPIFEFDYVPNVLISLVTVNEVSSQIVIDIP